MGEERINEVDLLLPKKSRRIGVDLKKKNPVICIVVAHKTVKLID
jgi:hypothetical protein